MIIFWKDAQQRPRITYIIARLVNSLSVKFDFKYFLLYFFRVFSEANLGEVSQMCIWSHLSTICDI